MKRLYGLFFGMIAALAVVRVDARSYGSHRQQPAHNARSYGSRRQQPVLNLSRISHDCLLDLLDAIRDLRDNTRDYRLYTELSHAIRHEIEFKSETGRYRDSGTAAAVQVPGPVFNIPIALPGSQGVSAGSAQQEVYAPYQSPQVGVSIPTDVSQQAAYQYYQQQPQSPYVVPAAYPPPYPY